MRHLLDTADLDRSDIEEIFELTDRMVEVSARPIPKIPALRGRTVCTLFFENSTRTRLSFEVAARRLSADVLSFSAASSSVNKGESVRDTVETVSAMGIDAVIIRHRSSGVPAQATSWTEAAVVSGGDGWHAHPTQGLLDGYTAHRRLGGLDGRTVVFVGDIQHSRVARSTTDIFQRLGARVSWVAPPTLLPADTSPFGVEVSHDLDAVLPAADICYVLRIQTERIADALLPDLREYVSLFGVTPARLGRLGPDALIMHPGPMIRGVEISGEAADDPRSVVTEQVANGVAVRMAVLMSLLSGSGEGEDTSGESSEAPTAGRNARGRCARS